MGDLIPFRRRKTKKWTRPGDYGQVLPASTWQGKPPRSRRQWLQRWILPVLFVFIFAWTYYSALPEQATAPDASSLRVDPPVTACGAGRSTVCVVDGDTIKIDARSIRIIGIDAPELHPPRCVQEAQQGLAARDKLVTLANQGPFFLTGSGARDEYGRELFNLVRLRADKSVQSLADDLIASGLVRRYESGSRRPWC